LHASQRVDPARHFQADPIGVLELASIVPLALGVLAEFTWFRAARVINVGYYAGWALYFCIGFAFSLVGAFWFREPEHWVLAVMFTAVPYATLSVVLWFLYRSTNPARRTSEIAA
jgi:hypothetical protein